MPKPLPAATAALSGGGQHFALELEIPIGTDTDVTLSGPLAAAYADRDEVETPGSWPPCVRTVQFAGASDVGRRSSTPRRTAWASAGQLMDATPSLNIPIHVRLTPDASRPSRPAPRAVRRFAEGRRPRMAAPC